jgi:hypothetical protein
MEIRELQNEILITTYAAAGDGGSLYFECKTNENTKFDLLFTQYFFLEDFPPHMIPGRIYLNEKLIALKSEEEKTILNSIQNFQISEELDKMDSTLRDSLEVIFRQLTDFFYSGLSVDINEKIENKKLN